MLEVLIKIFSLDIAVIIGSPGILALVLFLLGTKNHPKYKVLGFLIGSLLVGSTIALLGFYVGDLAPSQPHKTLTAACIDLGLGLIFAFYGIHALVAKERKFKPSKDTSSHFFRWLIVGLLISATNFDSVLLSLAATKEVSGSGLNPIPEIILTLINIGFFISPVALPLLFYVLAPAFAQHFLTKANKIVIKYSRYIVALLFIVFALILIDHGLQFFLGPF